MWSVGLAVPLLLCVRRISQCTVFCAHCMRCLSVCLCVIGHGRRGCSRDQEGPLWGGHALRPSICHWQRHQEVRDVCPDSADISWLWAVQVRVGVACRFYSCGDEVYIAALRLGQPLVHWNSLNSLEFILHLSQLLVYSLKYITLLWRLDCWDERKDSIPFVYCMQMSIAISSVSSPLLLLALLFFFFSCVCVVISRDC